jgi:hypothetical protein
MGGIQFTFRAFLALILIGLTGFAGEIGECNRFLSFLARNSTSGILAYPVGSGKIASVSLLGTPLIQDRFVDFQHANFYDPNAIYVGVSNHPNEGTYHFYLIAGTTRVDGQYGPTVVREGKGGNIPYGTKGVIFKLPVGAEKMRAVQYLARHREGVKHANCLEPVINILAGAGLEIEALYSGSGFASPVAFISNLLRGNIREGQQYIPVHLLSSSTRDLSHFITMSPELDQSIAEQLSRRPPR